MLDLETFGQWLGQTPEDSDATDRLFALAAHHFRLKRPRADTRAIVFAAALITELATGRQTVHDFASTLVTKARIAQRVAVQTIRGARAGIAMEEEVANAVLSVLESVLLDE